MNIPTVVLLSPRLPTGSAVQNGWDYYRPPSKLGWTYGTKVDYDHEQTWQLPPTDIQSNPITPDYLIASSSDCTIFKLKSFRFKRMQFVSLSHFGIPRKHHELKIRTRRLGLDRETEGETRAISKTSLFAVEKFTGVRFFLNILLNTVNVKGDWLLHWFAIQDHCERNSNTFLKELTPLPRACALAMWKMVPYAPKIMKSGRKKKAAVTVIP